MHCTCSVPFRPLLLAGSLILSFGCTATATPVSADREQCGDLAIDTPTAIRFSQPPALLDRRGAVRSIAVEVSKTTSRGDTMPLPVWFLTGVDGAVLRAVADGSTGAPAIDNAVLTAAVQFKFTPAYRDTTPVCAWFRMYVPSVAPRN